MKLKGKVAIVVGGGRNVGEGVAHRFVKEGAKVCIFDADQSRAEGVVAALKAQGGEASYVLGNVTRPEDAKRLVQTTAQRYGQVDILVNCAAISDRKGLLDLEDDAWREVLDVTLSGSYYCMRHAAIQMVKQGHGGAIVNFSSGSAFRGSTRRIAYDAAKGGVVSMTQSAAVQLTQHGIRVNAIAPGMVGSQVGGAIPPEKRDAANLLGRITMPADMANVVLFLVSDEGEHIIGQCINVDAGASVMPWFPA